MAEALGRDFDFMRVDLYSIRARTVFGEMTLAPGAGWIPFLPQGYDAVLGSHWREAAWQRGAAPPPVPARQRVPGL